MESRLSWYAMSNTTLCPACLHSPAMLSHCSGVGSTPVGLCAQAWNRKMEPGGAERTSDTRPEKSSPREEGE